MEVSPVEKPTILASLTLTSLEMLNFLNDRKPEAIDDWVETCTDKLSQFKETVVGDAQVDIDVGPLSYSTQTGFETGWRLKMGMGVEKDNVRAAIGLGFDLSTGFGGGARAGVSYTSDYMPSNSLEQIQRGIAEEVERGQTKLNFKLPMGVTAQNLWDGLFDLIRTNVGDLNLDDEIDASFKATVYACVKIEADVKLWGVDEEGFEMKGASARLIQGASFYYGWRQHEDREDKFDFKVIAAAEPVEIVVRLLKQSKRDDDVDDVDEKGKVFQDEIFD